MDIIFYNCTDENEVVNKTLTDELSLKNCVMVNTDMLRPALKISKTAIGKTYCYIPTFGRYYFITSIETLPGEHLIIHCRVDVLMTYKGSIENLEGLISRNQDKEKSNKKLPDPSLPISSNRLIYTKSFGTEHINANQVHYLISIK